MCQIFKIGVDKLNLPYDYNLGEAQNLHARFGQIKANNNDALTIDDLRRVALWKINRILDVPDGLLEQLQDIARQENLDILSDAGRKQIKRLFMQLVSCTGIGFPVASAILKFLRPDIFPIIDVRAYRALFGKKLSYSQYSFNKYMVYAEKIYCIWNKYKEQRDLTPLLTDGEELKLCHIDEQLYAFDKRHNGTI